MAIDTKFDGPNKLLVEQVFLLESLIERIGASDFLETFAGALHQFIAIDEVQILLYRPDISSGSSVFND